MEPHTNFAEEIDFHELYFQEIVGRGAFGIVSRVRWRGKDVAVKVIETDAEKKAFILELKSLSRVDHPNIVKLYGACTSTKSPICLVMEYAEGGSLYNVLHGNGKYPGYTSAHAVSWALQCARGVDYLHSMKPKAIIHRDLKPPNLLLIHNGTKLKICDFGTACDIQTHMTNNKGSAAWMAPEVFEGSNYSEKCDIFSWGIILWEVLTRKKPFDEIGGPAFRIMWAVHNGTRPPLVKNVPKTLETLMIKCWSAVPQERPSMSDVMRVMEEVMLLFPGADEPLVYPDNQQATSVYDTPPHTNMTNMDGVDSHQSTIRDTLKETATGNDNGEVVPIVAPPTHRSTPVVVEEEDPKRTSAPASLAASRESLFEKSNNSRSSTPSVDIQQKRFSVDLNKLEEKDLAQAQAQAQAQFGGPSSTPPSRSTGHRRTGSYGNSPLGPSPGDSTSSLHHVSTAPEFNATSNVSASQTDMLGINSGGTQRSVSWTPGEVSNQLPGAASPIVTDRRYSHGDEPENYTVFNPALCGSPSYTNQDNATIAAQLALSAMDHQLRPLTPYQYSQESCNIFHEHCRLAQEYIQIQTNIALLSQRKHDLQQEISKDEKEQQQQEKYVQEFTQLTNENESLLLLHSNLKKQVELMRQKRQSFPGS